MKVLYLTEGTAVKFTKTLDDADLQLRSRGDFKVFSGRKTLADQLSCIDTKEKLKSYKKTQHYVVSWFTH